jgi:hypothetical protein
MKRKAEESTDVDRSGKAAKFNATQPEAGSSSSPVEKGAQQADQKQEKKNGRAWKDKGKDGSVKVGRRGRRREEPAEGEESTEPKAPRLPKRQCALLIGFCGTGYSGMQLYSARLLCLRNDSADCAPASPMVLEPSKEPYSMLWSKLVLYLQTTPVIQSR